MGFNSLLGLGNGEEGSSWQHYGAPSMYGGATNVEVRCDGGVYFDITVNRVET